jgi:phosphoribosylformimino-5-aminoimidazole carboxamide ribotide isomerase
MKIIIPAIDIIDGKCVRLSKGDYNTKIIYNENPLEVAKSFEAQLNFTFG